MKCELGTICSRLRSGKNIPAKFVCTQGKYPVYGGNGLRGYTDTYNFDGECAIIGRQGAFCGNVRYFKGTAYMTEHAVVVCANEHNSTQYLAYLLSTMQLGRLSGQSAQPGLSVKTLSKQVVDVPSLEVQNKIAAILRSLDDKIELNSKINKNLIEQMQLLYQSLITNCDCSLIRIGDIAQKVAMGPFGSNIKVSTFVSEGVPIISGNHLRSIFLEEPSYNFITEEHAQKLKNSIVYPRDIIFTHAGNIGQVAMIPNGCDYPYYMISQRQFYMRCDETKVVPELVLFFFHSREGKGKLLANANSTGVPSIAQPSTHLKNIEMPLPNKKDQDTWYKVIRPMVDEYVALCQENKRIAALRDCLLPKLMNGEIDIDGI